MAEEDKLEMEAGSGRDLTGDVGDGVVEDVSGGDGTGVVNPYAVTPERMAEATGPYDRMLEGYDRIINTLDAPESEEKRKVRERKERSKRLIGAVSDGLRALGNLYFTSQYAPDMYDHEKGSELGRTDALIEKMRARRAANDEAYMRYALGRAKVQGERARTVRELEDEAARRWEAQKRLEYEEQERPLQLAILGSRKDKEKNLADQAGYDAQTPRTKALYEPYQQEAELGVKSARKNNYRAQAASHNTTRTFLGKVYDQNSDDYDKAVRMKAEELNALHRRLEKNENGELVWKYDDDYMPIALDDFGYGQKRKPRKAVDIAAEVEHRLAEQEAKTREQEAKTREQEAKTREQETKTRKGYHAGEPDPSLKQSTTE